MATLLVRYSWCLAKEYRHHPFMSLTQIKPKFGMPIVLTKLTVERKVAEKCL